MADRPRYESMVQPFLVRVRPRRPLTPTQQIVADLVARGMRYPDIGKALSMRPETVKFHTICVAKLLPGDLPAQARVATWWRGATRDVLTGEGLPREPELVGPPPR